MLSRTALCINHQVLSHRNVVSQRIMYRSIHIAFRMQTPSLKTRSVIKISKYSPALGIYTKRYSSTTQAASAIVETNNIANQQIGEKLTSTILETIPDAPIPPVITPVVEALSSVAEPSFRSMGLGSWWPPGIIQQCLESLHVTCGLPWWGSIMIGTLVVRLCMFPLVIIAQRQGAVMSNNMPELTRLQTEMSEARAEKDQLKVVSPRSKPYGWFDRLDRMCRIVLYRHLLAGRGPGSELSARLAQQIVKYMKQRDCNPFKNLIAPCVQAPIFISVFMGLREMAYLPVESMASGGLWWFTDLTIADPYYILPTVTALTLSATIELGVDSARAQSLGMIRYGLRAIPVIIFPFTMNFPAAILCYWCTSNFISLLQVGFLKIETVRTYFKIPALVVHPPAVMKAKKGFIDGIKSSVANMKAAREQNARLHVDQVDFFQAGRRAIQKTYSYDPTKQLVTPKKATPIAMKKQS